MLDLPCLLLVYLLDKKKKKNNENYYQKDLIHNSMISRPDSLYHSISLFLTTYISFFYFYYSFLLCMLSFFFSSFFSLCMISLFLNVSMIVCIIYIYLFLGSNPSVIHFIEQDWQNALFCFSLNAYSICSFLNWINVKIISLLPPRTFS